MQKCKIPKEFYKFIGENRKKEVVNPSKNGLLAAFQENIIDSIGLLKTKKIIG